MMIKLILSSLSTFCYSVAVMPIAMSDTAHRFTLNYNNREYILETSLIHVALEAER